MSRLLDDALNAGDIDRLASLLAAGEDPNPLVEGGCSYDLLYSAVSGAHPVLKSEFPDAIDAVILLLRYGAKVDPPNPEYPVTPLMRAAQLPNAECARILLSAGANPNVIDEEGETPLRLFVKEEDVATVRLLVQCGADMYRCAGMDFMNPIGLAATMLNVEMVRIFVAHGADPMVPDLDRDTVLDRLRRLSRIGELETPEKLERFHAIHRLLGGE
jgi:uncharacterized protein